MQKNNGTMSTEQRTALHNAIQDVIRPFREMMADMEINFANSQGRFSVRVQRRIDMALRTTPLTDALVGQALTTTLGGVTYCSPDTRQQLVIDQQVRDDLKEAIMLRYQLNLSYAQETSVTKDEGI